MGKRNLRILRHQLPERLSELVGKEAHVVMRDGNTHFGRVLSADGNGLKVRDTNARWTSLKRHTHTLLLQDVMEVIVDIVTAY